MGKKGYEARQCSVLPAPRETETVSVCRATSHWLTCCWRHRGTGSCCCWQREMAHMAWGLHTAQWLLWYVYSKKQKCNFTQTCTLMSVVILPETTQLSLSCWLVGLWNEPLSHWKRWIPAGLGGQHTHPSIQKAEDWQCKASLGYTDTLFPEQNQTKINQPLQT